MKAVIVGRESVGMAGMVRGSAEEIIRTKGCAAYGEPPVTEEEKRTFDASANVVTAVKKNL